MNFPIVRYMAVWPSRRIVRVQIDRCKDKLSGYPLTVTSLEPTVDIGNGVIMYGDARLENGFHIAGLEVLELYKSRRQGEKDQLEKAHKEYAQLRRDLRTAQKKYKWGLKVVAEYKKFKQLHTPFFLQ
jgi:hypothetical protein